jgi:hypothetical protein
MRKWIDVDPTAAHTVHDSGFSQCHITLTRALAHQAKLNTNQVYFINFTWKRSGLNEELEHILELWGVRTYTKKTKLHGLSPRANYTNRACRRKLVPTFAKRGYHVVSVTDPYSRFLGFLDRSRYFFFQVAPQLYSRGWGDPVPDPLLLRKSGSAGNRTRTSGSVARNSDH